MEEQPQPPVDTSPQSGTVLEEEPAQPREQFRTPTTLKPLGRPEGWANPVDPKPPAKRPLPSNMKELLDNEDGLRVIFTGKLLIINLVEGYRAQVFAPSGMALAPTLNRTADAVRAGSVVVTVATPGQPFGAYEGTIAGSVAAAKSAEVYADIHKKPPSFDAPPSALQMLAHIALEGAAVGHKLLEGLVARLEKR